ncbi:hypothetical protein [uncultured Methylobacterium sp.]|uniref:hypothetical protein n=1 Tax=uncultured Methylobacterium sp. TaxID=157278 RepID=UPI0035CAB333
MMHVLQPDHAESYCSPAIQVSSDEFTRKLADNPDIPYSPFEILGESIVPGLTNVPAVLQGTFIQATNLGNDLQSLFLFYVPTAPFVFGPSSNKVVLGANFIDDNLKIFDFTSDFRTQRYLSIRIPAGKTFIVGLQYFINPNAALTAPTPVGSEAMGNRGIIQLLPSGAGKFLVTATVRQNFIRSLSNPTDIISSTAYSVPISTGPIVKGSSATAGLLP